MTFGSVSTDGEDASDAGDKCLRAAAAAEEDGINWHLSDSGLPGMTCSLYI